MSSTTNKYINSKLKGKEIIFLFFFYFTQKNNIEEYIIYSNKWAIGRRGA